MRQADLTQTFTIRRNRQTRHTKFMSMTTMVFTTTFNSGLVTLPRRLYDFTISYFNSTPARHIMAVDYTTTVHDYSTSRTVLTVMTVFTSRFLPNTTAFTSRVTRNIMIMVPIALRRWPVTPRYYYTQAILRRRITHQVVNRTFQ